jgi:hypothetical protein
MNASTTTPAAKSPAEKVAPYRWQKGVSGNPRGKRKNSVSLAAAVQRLLTKEPQLVDDVARTIVNAAIAGDVSAARLLFERLDGQKATGFFNINVDASDRRTAVSISPQVLGEIAESRRLYEEKLLCPQSHLT